jgi:hypothetical protein
MELNLGYLKLELESGWIARSELVEDGIELLLMKNAAMARISILSAGVENYEEALEQLYTNMEQNYRLQGLHFDDLADDFDDEMITEIPSGPEDFSVEHIFLRLVGNQILVASLSQYAPSEEDELRIMLASLKPGELIQNQPALTRLTIVQNLDSWDRMGNIAIYSGTV